MGVPEAGTAPSPSSSHEASGNGGGGSGLLAREVPCLSVTVCWGFATILLGFVLGYGLVDRGWLPVSKDVGQKFETDLARRVEMDWKDRFVAIAKPNFTCFFVLLFGIVTLGIEATVHLGFLGVATGIAVGRLTAGGVPFGRVASLLLPHAFPELLGFCLAGSLGFRAALMFHRYLKGGRLIEEREIARMARVACASFVCLVVAAVVESRVTPAMAALREVGPFLH